MHFFQKFSEHFMYNKSPVKFRTVTVGCNTSSNNANKILLNVLKQIYDLILNTDNP